MGTLDPYHLHSRHFIKETRVRRLLSGSNMTDLYAEDNMLQL